MSNDMTFGLIMFLVILKKTWIMFKVEIITKHKFVPVLE